MCPILRKVECPRFVVALLVGLTPLTVSAQNARPFEGWKDTGTVRTTKMRCQDLRSLTSYDFSIDTSTLVAAQGERPEHCHIVGQVAPEVRFHVSLPTKWNGRLYMFGNGGYAGESLDAQGRAGFRDRALAAGFAVTNTNTGHDAAREPLASFATNPQKLIDYAYRAVHVTAMTAKEIARSYYGTAASRSYFDGCSTGGRQGLISAQRFPHDFDGIIVGAPVLDFTGTMMHYALMQQAMRNAPALANKFELLAARYYGKCDKVDGIADGIVDDPRRCPFDPATDVPLCTAVNATANDCLTEAEMAAMKAVYSPVVVNGATVFPGFTPGAEALMPSASGPTAGWHGWIATKPGLPPSLGERFVETFFKYMVTPGREQDYKAFDPAKDVAQLRQIGALLNATDPDLSAFHARGGKILLYHGWAEPALSPLMSIKYFEDVQKTMGAKTDDVLRMFMMPGVFHCGGGPGPDAFDRMTPLVDWVERGVAPSRIVVSKLEGNAVKRTRALCPYPQVAKYKGAGSTDDAASFECTSESPSSSSRPRGPSRR